MKHSLFTFTKVLGLFLTVAMLIGSGCDAYGQKRGKGRGKKRPIYIYLQHNPSIHSPTIGTHSGISHYGKTLYKELEELHKKLEEYQKILTPISSSNLKDVFQNPWETSLDEKIRNLSQVFHPDCYLGDVERNQRMLDSCLSLQPNKKEWFIRQMNACIGDSVELSYEEIMNRRLLAIKDTGLRQVQQFYWLFEEKNMIQDGRLVIVRRLGFHDDSEMLREQICHILLRVLRLQVFDPNFKGRLSVYSLRNVKIQSLSENESAVILDCEEAIAKGVILPLREISDAIYDYRHKKHETQE